MKKKTKVKMIVIFIVSISILILFLIIKNVINENLEFTAENWKKSDVNDRYRYLNSFHSQYELIGMKNDEVIRLLGEPNLNNYKPSNNRYTYKYYVKHDDWIGPMLLEINFENNRVFDYEIVEGDW